MRRKRSPRPSRNRFGHPAPETTTRMTRAAGPPARCGACPACDARLGASPHRVCAEMRCPRCRAELWVILAKSGPHFLPRRGDVGLEECVADLVASHLAARAPRGDVITLLRDGHAPELNLDSVDYVELVLEIEDALERVR